MKLNRLSQQQRCLCSELLSVYAGFNKQASPGEFLHTVASQNPFDEDLQPLVSLLEQPNSQAALSREQLSRLTKIIDFMAVAEPDLEARPWRQETLELASSLRKIFCKEFGESVYT